MENRNLNFYIVDVFAEEKYSGNQLAVFTNAKNISSEEMAAIARETNFSETTFITAVHEAQNTIDVRIFTPGGEIPFAGHPTLGTAYIANKVFWNGSLKSITLNLKVGSIPVDIEGQALWMKQVQPKIGEEFDKSLMSMILGIEKGDFVPEYPILPISTGLPFFIVPLKSLNALKKIDVNVKKAREHFEGKEAAQVMAFTTESYNPVDKIASRVFVPLLGIPEDPATGSATGCLAAYLLKTSFFQESMVELSVAQGYEIKRPSRLYINAELIENEYSIMVGGSVIEISEGRWY